MIDIGKQLQIQVDVALRQSILNQDWPLALSAEDSSSSGFENLFLKIHVVVLLQGPGENLLLGSDLDQHRLLLSQVYSSSLDSESLSLLLEGPEASCCFLTMKEYFGMRL